MDEKLPGQADWFDQFADNDEPINCEVLNKHLTPRVQALLATPPSPVRYWSPAEIQAQWPDGYPI